MSEPTHRRSFLTLLGGAAAAWPLGAGAQQKTMPVIGYLTSGGRGPQLSDNLAQFLRGLGETGYVEGRNVAIEYRSAEGHYDRLPALAAGLVRHPVDVIFANAIPSARAVKAATTTIPIVFSVGGDPVREGLVLRLNRPEGNLTGVTAFFGELVAKRLQLLRELVPSAAVIGVLVNPSNPNVEYRLQDLQGAARALGQQIQVFNAVDEMSIDTVFADLTQRRAGALLVIDDSLFVNHWQQLIALAARNAIPASYAFRDDAIAGGLMSYSASSAEGSRLVGVYTGRILKGEKPADLPVQQPVKFEMVINMKTAKALGLAVPDKLLALADEVIE